MDKTVLVPLDGSAIAEGALPTASWLAGALGADLHLVATTVGPTTTAEQAYLDGVHTDPEVGDVIRDVVRHRFPAPGIVDTLGRIPEPTLCMTTKGASGWGTALLGSVTDEVLRSTDVPAVLLGPSCSPGSTSPDGALVVGIDGSEESFAVLAAVAELAKRLDRPIDVVTTAQTGGSDARSAVAEAEVADACSRLRRLGAEATPHVLRGASAPDLILAFAAERPAALVAVGTHGRGGLSAHALGRVASEIVGASVCPVLVRRVRR